MIYQFTTDGQSVLELFYFDSNILKSTKIPLNSSASLAKTHAFTSIRNKFDANKKDVTQSNIQELAKINVIKTL